MSLPRVLIIGSPFCQYIGGGITMTNLFSQWDKDKIAVACIGHFLDLKINTAICDNYYQLGEKERKLKFPLSLLQKKFKSGPVKVKNNTGIAGAGLSTPGFRHKMVTKGLYPLLRYFGVYHNLSKLEVSQEFCDWVAAFNPDIIYTQAYELEGVRFITAVQKAIKKPMAFHMMDDWPSSSNEKGLFKNTWAKKIDTDFRNMLDRASLLMSIGEDMSDEYRRRYHKEFVPFHNPINIDFWKKSQKTNYTLSKQPYVLYAGRIGLGIDSSLILIAQAIEKINVELNISLKFVIRSDEKPAWMSNYRCAEFHHFLPYEEVPKMLSDADVLVLPYDFSEESIHFIKYSMPTKASEYMMSGTPVVLFAPPDTAVVNYANRYDCFELSTKNSEAALVTSIKNVITNEARRKELAAKAIAIAEQKHNSGMITADFRKELCSMQVTEHSVN